MLSFVRVVVLLVIALVAASACVTTHALPALYAKKSFAIVSVSARRNVASWGIELSPMDFDNDLGSEVIDMTLGDEQDRIARVLGGDVMRVEDVVQLPAYAHVRETSDPEDWSRVQGMVTVDTTPAADASLGDLATALDVDAVVSLRHEWSLVTERTAIGLTRSMLDRCTLVVVDNHGTRLWDDTVDARVPVWGMGVDLGINGSSWADGLRALARRASADAFTVLTEHHRRDRPKAPAAPPAGATTIAPVTSSPTPSAP